MKGTDVASWLGNHMRSIVQEVREARDFCLQLLINLERDCLVGCSHINVENRHMKTESCKWLVSWLSCPQV